MDGGNLATGTNKKERLFTPFGLALFALSLGYIGAEALFNMKLLDVAGSVKSNPEEIRNLQHFGRAVSGYGFSLLTLGVFATSGFRLTRRRDWVMFAVLAIISFIPFVLKFEDILFGILKGSAKPSDEPWDGQLSMLPFLGLAAVLLSAGKFRAHLIIGLVLMAWPAMFLGQKMLIERYLVDRTGWHERQDARYMLMLRGALEDGTMKLGDLQFVDASRGEPSMKAARIIVSTLWMLSPDGVLKDVAENKEDVVQKAAASGTWFSSNDLYAKYVKKVSDTRDKALADAEDKYYKPYIKASQMYQKASDSAAIQAEADKAVAQVEAGIDAGWDKYQKGVHDYRQSETVVADLAVRSLLPYAGRMNAYCRTGNCPNVNNVSMKKAIKEAQDRAERDFYDHTGYHSDIPDRATFVAQPPTQDKIRKGVEGMMESSFNIPGFKLPEGWKYDPATLGKSIKDMIGSRADAAWKAKFGDKLAPNLPEDKFFAAVGVGSIPTTASLLMSQEDFYKKVILPGNQKMVDEMVADLQRDKDKYPPDASSMEEGKDYISAVYIPAISLVISLTVVVITLLRGFMALMDLVLRSGGQATERHWHFVGAGAVVVLFMGMLFSLPHLFPNPYASGPGYDKYYAQAKEKHPIIAGILDWSVQVQPIIYRLGKDIRRITG